jgi:hypothetical protein
VTVIAVPDTILASQEIYAIGRPSNYAIFSRHNVSAVQSAMQIIADAYYLSCPSAMQIIADTTYVSVPSSTAIETLLTEHPTSDHFYKLGLEVGTNFQATMPCVPETSLKILTRV